jgi:hypothetical protein
LHEPTASFAGHVAQASHHQKECGAATDWTDPADWQTGERQDSSQDVTFCYREMSRFSASDGAMAFDEEETDALAALMRIDFARLNKVMAVVRGFIKSAEGNSVSYSKYREAFMNAVSRFFSETADVNMIFTCFLVTPIGKRHHDVVARPIKLAASMETIWKKSVVTLSKAFYYDVAQMISLFQDYLDNPGQFH